ncbi:MAG: hypothetical protein ABII22_06425, partial [Candidatus Micrarchaeota archaeon]
KSGTTVTASDKDGTKKYADKCEGNLVRSYNCDGSNVVENPVECEANQVCQNGACVAATCANGGPACAANKFCDQAQGKCMDKCVPKADGTGITLIARQGASPSDVFNRCTHGTDGLINTVVTVSCSADGNAVWNEAGATTCPANELCDAKGRCYSQTCELTATGIKGFNSSMDIRSNYEINNRCYDQFSGRVYSCMANIQPQYSYLRCAAGSTCSNGQCVAPSCEEFEDGYKVVETTAQGTQTFTDTCEGLHGEVLKDYSCDGSRAIYSTATQQNNGKYCVGGRWVDDPSTCTLLVNGVNVRNQSWGSVDYVNRCDGNRIASAVSSNWLYACGSVGGVQTNTPIDCSSEGKVCQDGRCVMPQ